MDIDTRPLSSSGPSQHKSQTQNQEQDSEMEEQEKGEEKEVLNSRGKIQVGGTENGEGENWGGGFGYCSPGEGCEDCG